MSNSSRWLLVAGLGVFTQEPPAALPSFATPGISPDGSEIAFVSAGDIWTVPASGGEARLLVSHAAVESRPLYSPDGRELAFNSTRAGSVDVWVLTLATGALRRLTFEDGAENLDGWSADGKWLYYSSSSRDIAGMNDVYRVRSGGGMPIPVSADRYASEYWAAEAPDGRSVAITARGTSAGSWWRKGSSHLEMSQLVLLRPGTPPRYEALTDGEAREGWPMWSADGASLWYVSDRGGAQNLWSRPVRGPGRRVTTFTDGRVLWPSISRDGKRIAFERDFEIWTLETATGRAARVPITRRGAGPVPTVERLSQGTGLQDLALAPDGKKVAFVVRGEIFAASAKDGGTAARVTSDPAMDQQVAWAPDSRRLVYASSRGPLGALNLVSYDFTTGQETRLTDQALNDVTPRFSPDGKQVAFVRDGRELRVLDLEGRRERVLATGVMDREPFTSPRSFAWSPDGKWLAYFSTGARGFTNLWVVPAAGGEPTQVTFLANAFTGSVSWGPDGSYLMYSSSQRTEPGSLVRVDLVLRTPKFREDQFRDLFNQETPRPGRPAPGAPAAPPRDSAPAAGPGFELREVRKRLSLIPVGVDVFDQVISPDGKWVVMAAGAEGRSNLYAWPLDELSTEERVARQLTSTAGGKQGIAFSPDSKEVYYLESGRLMAYNLDTRQGRAIAVTAELEVDFDREKMAVFAQAWAIQRDNFYDPGYHGADWNAVRRAYEPRVAGARTPDEMRRILGFMVGELNASHSGINPPGGAGAPPTGRLGVRFDPAALEAGTGFRLGEVIPLSPAAVAGLTPGDWLLAVDGTRLDAGSNVDALLTGKAGRRVTLRVGATATEAGRDVVVRPVSTGEEKNLLYRAWVEDRRAYVARISNGRLGYVHLPDMGAGTLAQLAVDLDTENHGRDGVVIDIRNNSGGFINAYALDIFSRRPYLTMQPRGGVAAPARSQLGQRALEKPTVLVINQHSLSDAEDFTEGYKAMGLGTVVGEPTAGWIIYTSNLPLQDGTIMRMPFIRITGSDGRDMELHPRQPDITVVRPVGESYGTTDVQLDVAVRTLLGALR